MKKRIFSFVLAVLMIASLLPATALAADIVYSGTCGAEGDGRNLTWTLDSEGVLTISGSGNMYDYYYNDDDLSNAPWYRIRSRVKSAVIAEGVTSIGKRAFTYCESLTSVTIPDSVTLIGDSAFYCCTSLTSVTIPDSVTSIGRSAFYDCTSLTSVTIPDSMTSIGWCAFAGCTSLKSVTIPDSVTSIDVSAFDGCTSLTSVTIPDSVTSIGVGAFTLCTSLTGIWVAEGNSHYSSDASGVLFNKDKTTLVQCPGAFAAYTIPDSVTSIGKYAFSGCDNLTDVYYTGTEIAWNKIKINDYNDALENATIHYFSEWTREKEPTCTEPGSETSVCSVKDCDKTFTREIPALGHDLKDDAAVAATCTTAGTTAGKHCTRCDYKEGMETIAALGHAWDEGMVTKEATETTQGSMTYTCTRCLATKRDILPASGLVATAVYNDVKNDTSWFYPGVQYCLSYGLMSGMGNGSFAPGEYTTRAQVAQILYNLHGNPEVSGGTPFTDVPEGAWYQKAVTWAHSVGIVNGVTATTFSPNANITRQDFVLMLMRYLNNVRMVDRTWTPDDLSRFVDAGSVGFWALDAMKDAVAINAISGVPVDGRLYIQPARNATRAEAAKILMMFHETMTK